MRTKDIAEVISAAIQECKTDSVPDMGARLIADHLAYLIEQDHPRFNRDKFIRECGL